ncbi:Crp/Fnr family transcriptional regulator [Clostridium chrysemydis]|uniref:Crp/Fnr family transcriptional regulator n=1 Tax=Clostridium chrysemydis TaxID=2665504 RepID=UPI00188399FF|nr:Crp/Fnr family transcriptional regulator [Clostridium chrysemydis]
MRECNIKNDILNVIIPKIETKINVYEKDIISKQETNYGDLKILLNGVIKVSCILIDGNELILGIYKAPVIFIPKLTYNNSFVSLFNVVALSKCELGIIKEHTFVDMLKESPNLSINFIEYSDLVSQMIFMQMRSALVNNKKKALMSILLRLYNIYGLEDSNKQIINFKISNVLLSKFINTSTETISRLLSELKKENLISINSGFFEIIDIAYLKSELGCCFCNNTLCHSSL